MRHQKASVVHTKSIERQIKAAIPLWLKKAFSEIACNPVTGALVKLSRTKSNLFNGVYDYKLVDNTTAARIFFGLWESAEIKFSKRFADNPTIVELGSSIGVTYGVLSQHYPKSKYICVEASPKNFQKLRKLVSFIGDGNQVTLVNKAISYNQTNKVRFTETSTTQGKISDSGSNNSILVDSIGLSELLGESLCDNSYTLIADIEGAEAEIFFKDPTSLERCSKIICELENTRNHSIKSQIEQLAGLGFSVIEQYSNVYFLERTRSQISQQTNGNA